MSKKKRNDVENIETVDVTETPDEVVEEPVEVTVEEEQEPVKEPEPEVVEEPVEVTVEENSGEVDNSEKFLVKINIHPSKIVKAMERLDKKGFKYLQTNNGNLYLEQRFDTEEEAKKCRTAMHRIGLLAEVVFK